MYKLLIWKIIHLQMGGNTSISTEHKQLIETARINFEKPADDINEDGAVIMILPIKNTDIDYEFSDIDCYECGEPISTCIPYHACGKYYCSLCILPSHVERADFRILKCSICGIIDDYPYGCIDTKHTTYIECTTCYNTILGISNFLPQEFPDVIRQLISSYFYANGSPPKKSLHKCTLSKRSKYMSIEEIRYEMYTNPNIISTDITTVNDHIDSTLKTLFKKYGNVISEVTLDGIIIRLFYPGRLTKEIAKNKLLFLLKKKDKMIKKFLKQDRYKDYYIGSISFKKFDELQWYMICDMFEDAYEEIVKNNNYGYKLGIIDYEYNITFKIYKS